MDKSHSKETGGTGSGLSIVKHAVMIHNVNTSVQSEVGKATGCDGTVLSIPDRQVMQ